MTDELVKRLRSMHWCVTTETNGVGVSDRKVALEAAAAIEQLTAERDEAINQLDSAIHSQIVLEKRTAAVMEDRKFILEERDRTFALMLARAEKAEAEWRRYESAWMTAEGKLADAMEGLEKCQAELDEYSRQEYPLDHTVHERYRQRDYDANPARITLAALKGNTHD